MPIRAEVEGVGTLEFPDGTDPAVIQATVKRAVAGRYQTPSQRRGENMDERMARAPQPRNFSSSIAHGGIDTAEAFAQIASHGATALGLPQGSNYPFVASPKIVEESANQARELVNRKLGEPNSGGLDIARGLSSGILKMPYLGGVGTAPTMLGRTAQAVRAGGIGGALTPVKNSGEQSGLDFLKDKTFQAGTGAAIGGVAQPALEFGAAGVQNIANRALSRAKGAVSDLSDDAARKIAESALRQQGVAFDGLERNVQQSILADVKEAMKKYGGVNASALSRQADFRALDVDPLQPWVTRDPVQWGQYKNLEMAKDAGEPLIQARAALDRKLVDRLGKLRGPGNTGDAYESGRVIEEGFRAAHGKAKDNVTALYDKFSATAPNVSADPKRMVDTILDSVERDALGDFLGPLKNLINDFATGKRPTTPDSLYRAQQVANAVVRKGGPEAMAARKIVEGIDNELEQMGRDMSAVGPEMAQAAEILQKARRAHRSIKMAEEAVPALKAVANGEFAAEDFFTKYVLGGDVKEVAAMWANSSDKMKQAARSQIADYLKKVASGGGAEDAAVFRQGRFTELLESPGMNQKIQIILGNKGLEEVKRIGRAAESAIRTPAGTRYNTSGSAMEMMNLLRRSTGFPVVGPMVTEPLQKLLTQQQAANMGRTSASSVGRGVLDPFYEEILRRSRMGAGLLSPMVGAGVAGELSR